jgi:peptidoglycan/LPS O-acetylase OafA/YrhL
MLYLGKISYGLYVFHSVGLTLAGHLIFPHRLSTPLLRASVGLPITIGLAAISYRYLEAPFLRLKERFTHIQSRPV